MTCFFTSNPFDYTNGRFNKANGFTEALAENLKREIRVLFVCSYPDSHDKTDYYAKFHISALEDCGFSLSAFNVLDGRNGENAKALVDETDLIILAGGHVPTQNRFFNKINLKACLEGFDGVIVGISAGSMNAAETVYAQPEIEGEAVSSEYRRFLIGLGLTDINVIPHYAYIKDTVLDGLKLFEEITFPDSMGKRFYAISDGGYIYKDSRVTEVRGECFLISDGRMSKICGDGEARRL